MDKIKWLKKKEKKYIFFDINRIFNFVILSPSDKILIKNKKAIFIDNTQFSEIPLDRIWKIEILPETPKKSRRWFFK